MTTPDPLPDLPAGIYQHYKGHLYLVLGYAKDANHEDEHRIVVVYVGLQLDGSPGKIRMHARTAADFHAVVDATTGEAVPVWDGTQRPLVKRFTYLGPAML